MKSLRNSDDGAPLSEEISQRSTRRAHRAAHRGAWKIAGDLPSSFRYAAQGLGYGFISQRNFRIQLGGAAWRSSLASGWGCRRSSWPFWC